MTISIIIPVREINAYIRESIPHIMDLDYPDYEVLIFPDEASEEHFPRTRIIPTGPVGPAQKRDCALKVAKGTLLAFLDDDAYPDKNWLKAAVRHFGDEEVAAVGGPAVTPVDDSLLQKAGGGVFASFLGGGSYRYRYVPMAKRALEKKIGQETLSGTK